MQIFNFFLLLEKSKHLHALAWCIKHLHTVPLVHVKAREVNQSVFKVILFALIPVSPTPTGSWCLCKAVIPIACYIVYLQKGAPNHHNFETQNQTVCVSVKHSVTQIGHNTVLCVDVQLWKHWQNTFMSHNWSLFLNQRHVI